MLEGDECYRGKKSLVKGSGWGGGAVKVKIGLHEQGIGGGEETSHVGV